MSIEDRKTTTVRIFDKLEKMEIHLNEINVTLVRQHESLSEHIRRTIALEKAVEPLQAHKEQMIGAAKLLGLLAVLATIVGTILLFK